MECPEKMFDLLGVDLKAIAERSICELLKVELSMPMVFYLE